MSITAFAGMTSITAALRDAWVRNAVGALTIASKAKAEVAAAAIATPARTGTNFDNIFPSIQLRRYGGKHRALGQDDHHPEGIFFEFGGQPSPPILGREVRALSSEVETGSREESG
jgi:hypothetical protein